MLTSTKTLKNKNNYTLGLILGYLQFLYKYNHIIEMCNIKYFICDPVSVTKKLRPSQAKIKYQCAHNNVIYNVILKTYSKFWFCLLFSRIINN